MSQPNHVIKYKEDLLNSRFPSPSDQIYKADLLDFFDAGFAIGAERTPNAFLTAAVYNILEEVSDLKRSGKLKGDLDFAVELLQTALNKAREIEEPIPTPKKSADRQPDQNSRPK